MSDSTLAIPFTGDIDDQIDPNSLPPGSLVYVTNANFDADQSIGTRYGYTRIGGAELKGVRRLVTFADELLAVDGTQLWAYDAEGNTWKPKDVVSRPGLTHRPLYNTSTSFSSIAIAHASGYRIVAWVDTSDQYVRSSVYDAETGALVLGPIKLSASTPAYNVQLAVVGTTVVCAYSYGLAATIEARSLQLSPLGSWTAEVNISNTALAGQAAIGAYSICSNGSLLFLAYETAPVVVGGGHTGQYRFRSFNASLTMQAQSVIATPIHYWNSGVISIDASAATLWFGTDSNGGITDGTSANQDQWLLKLDATTLANLGSLPITAGNIPSGEYVCVVAISNTVCAAIWGDDGYYQGNWFNGAGTVGTTALELKRFRLVSAPFYIASTGELWAFAWAAASDDAAGTENHGSYYLVSLGTATEPAKVSPQLLGVLCPRIVALESLKVNGTFFFSLAVRAVVTPTGFEVVLPLARGVGRMGMDLFTVDMTEPSYRWSPTTVGRELYLSGFHYDGDRLVENGFARNPTVISVTGLAVGAGFPAGTYEFVCTFGRVNANGNLEESAPSTPFQYTPAANVTGFVISVAPLTITQQQRLTPYGTTVGADPSPVYIIVYRTQILSSGDTLHYRVWMEPFPAANANNLDPATPNLWVQITDAIPDATIATHTVLYTDTGELPHNAPESFTATCAHKDRVWGIGADQRTIWYSQVYSDGSVPAWNELQTITVDDTNEPLTALASLYDKLLIFTATRIYVVYGDGPSIAGTGNDLTAPQRVPAQGGCIDPRSIVNTPMGIMFQALAGFLLIDEGLNVTFIGRNITRSSAPYPICTAATFCQDSSTVRFALESAEGDTGGANTAQGALATFDVRRARWSLHMVTRNDVTTGTAPMQAATWHPTLGYCAAHIDAFGANAACQTYRENTLADPAPWLDFGSHFVQMDLLTAPIKASNDQQGFQRVRRVRTLGTYYDAHGLAFNVGYNYNDPNEPHAFSDAEVLGNLDGTREQVRIIPAQGRCEAIQIRITTTAPDTPPPGYTGRSLQLSGLSFEIRPSKGGFRRIGAGGKS